jgi:colanic acid/amylovoran biosynthesis glycosyltransferase
MKIVLCSHDGENYFGGPYEWAKRIAIEWRKRGYQVFILFLSDAGKGKSSVYQYLKQEGFSVHLLKKSSLLQYSDNTEDRVAWFVKKTKEIKPDIFIANSILEALYACPQIERLGIKTYGVYHTPDQRYSWMNDLFVKQRTFGPSNMVFVSQYLFDLYSTDHRADFVIGCGTDSCDRKASFSTNPYSIVFAGKLTVEAKQIHKLIDAFEYVLERLGPVVQFHIYGSGPEEQNVRKRTAGNPGIQFHGFISSDKIQEVFLKYQSFVLLSDFEGLPVALMEAMAVGLVPICLDIPSGISELVNNEVNGFIIKDRNEGLNNVLAKLINSQHDWEQLSSNAIAKIDLRFTTKAVADQWDEAFRIGLLGDGSDRLNLPDVPTALVFKDYRKPTIRGYIASQSGRLLNRFQIFKR